jgi:hypothetical protein
MAATTEEGTEMRRKKRFTIKLVALGLAVVAIAPTSAQAWVDEGGAGGTQVVSSDDRPLHGTSYSSNTEPNVIASPDDRAFSRTSPGTSQPTLVSSGDDFELGMLGITGIVLALVAAAALIAVYEGRRYRLAGA